MTGETLARRLWTAAQTDQGLLTRLRVTYRGRLDVLDALWWRAHPLTLSPGGQPDPASGLADLQAAVYSPAASFEPLVEFVDPITGEAVHATENAHRLRKLMQELKQDAATLDFTLERLSDWTDDAAGSRGASDGGRGLSEGRRSFTDDGRPAPVSAAAAVAAAHAVSGSAVADHRRAPLLALLAFAAGVAAGVVGTMTTMGLDGNRLPGALSPPKTSVASGGSAAPGDALQIFARPAEFLGGKVPELGREFVTDSIRRIPEPRADDAGYGVFVARRSVDRLGIPRLGADRLGSDRYCIILKYPNDKTDFACADHAALAKTGLRLDAVLLQNSLNLDTPHLPYVVDITISRAEQIYVREPALVVVIRRF